MIGVDEAATEAFVGEIEGSEPVDLPPSFCRSRICTNIGTKPVFNRLFAYRQGL